MKSLRIGAALLLLSALPAVAADWQIDTGKSTLRFTGKQAGAPFEGQFKGWNGQISFDPAHPEAGRARIEIDMRSAATGDPQKDGSLPEADWFSVKRFPKAVFEATSFRPTGGNGFEAVGNLTIRDVKKDVVLPFTLEITGSTARAKGGLTLLRNAYGVGQGGFSSPDSVAFEVAVSFDLSALQR